ncbi:MAG: oligosaccharide flippase family protein, partial [Candidatus Magnetoovum sp. WYHC-5]|nr:oligosaccharide flippase family protein [Candidatus Magnetoovum sp. WYHC-5]
MSPHKESILKSISRYTSSNIYQRFCGIINVFIKPKLLTPELYGLWNLLSIFITYATYLHLGTRNSMFYLLPFYKARKDRQRCKIIESTTYYGSLFMTLPVVACIIVYAIWADISLVFRIGLITVCIIVLLNWYFDYYFNYLAAYKDFKIVSFANYKRASIAVVLNVALIYFFHIYGLYMASVITLVIIVIYLRKNAPVTIEAGFHLKEFIHLVKKGFPIMIYNITNELVSTSDKLVVAVFLDHKQLGFYAITGLVFNFLMQIPIDARDVVEPHLMESFDENKKEEALFDFFFKPLAYTAYFMPFLIGGAFFTMPIFVEIVLPKYIPGIIPTQIVIVGCYFFSLAYAVRGIIVANNWQIKAAIIITVVLILNVMLCIFAIWLGFGINGVSVASDISFLVLLLSLVAFVKNKYHYTFKHLHKHMKDFYWTLPAMCIAIGTPIIAFSTITVNKYVELLLSLLFFYAL